MRTDYVGHCAAFPELADMLNQTQYLTPVLTPAQLEAAIVRPAEIYGSAVQPELVKTILDDAASPNQDAADALPLVQHTMSWMWEESWHLGGLKAPPRPSDDPPVRLPALRLDQYQINGGLRGILTRHAESALAASIAAGQTEERKALCEGVLKRLCERDLGHRYRRAPATLTELAEVTGSHPDLVRDGLEPFLAPTASFVEIRRTTRTEEEEVDICHESLIRQWPRLRDWADEEAEDVQTFRHLVQSAQRWRDDEKKERNLRTGGELEVVDAYWLRTRPREAWLSRYPSLDGSKSNLARDLPLVSEFRSACKLRDEDIQESVEAVRLAEIDAKVQKRVARLASFGAAIFVAFILFAWLNSTFQSERQRSNLFKVVGRLALTQDPLDTLLIAETWLQAEDFPTAAVDELARQVVEEFRLVALVEQLEVPLTVVAYRPNSDGSLLLTGDTRGLLRVWDIDARRPIAEKQFKEGLGPSCCSWRPDGDAILVSTGIGIGGGKAGVYNFILNETSGLGELTQAFDLYTDEDRAPPRAGAFSPADNVIVTTSFQSPVRLWDAQNGKSLDLAIDRQGFRAVLSPDGRRLAIATGGGVLVYDVEKARAGDEQTPIELRDTKLEGPWALSFNPADPDMLAVAGRSGVGVLWSLDDNGVAGKRTFLNEHGAIYTLAFSPSGSLVATAGEEGVVRLSPTDGDGSEPVILRGHGSTIYSLSFAPKGDTLAAVSTNGAARVWSVEPIVKEKLSFETDHEAWLDAVRGLIPPIIRPDGVTDPELDPQLVCFAAIGRAEEC